MDLQRLVSTRELVTTLLDESDNLSNNDRLTYKAMRNMLSKYNFVSVLSTESCFYSEVDSPNTYRRLTQKKLQNFARTGILMLGQAATAQRVSNVADTLLVNIIEETNAEDTRFMAINDNLFWDTRTSMFTDSPSTPCFKHLFDNADLVSSAIIQINPNFIDEDKVEKVHRIAYKVLEESKGDLPDDSVARFPRFSFIDTWACGDHGVYMDLLKAAATLFMSNKPKKVFALSGLMRNGKSSYIAMLRTMLGWANTSDVKLEGLKTMNFTEKLMGTMMNAPDEETPTDQLDPLSIAYYKSIAAHEPITMSRKFKEAPFIPTDFTCFLPYNQDPVWRGDGASACAKRMVIIPFLADLSKFDTAGRDFKRETFTPDMYTDLIGVLTAIARYYNDKEMTFSETSMAETEDVNSTGDSMSEYIGTFFRHFEGYDDAQTVFDDYTIWCKERGISFRGETKSSLMYHMKRIAGGVPKKTHRSIEGTGTRTVYIYPHNFRGLVFSNDLAIKGRTIADWHEDLAQDPARSIIGFYHDITEDDGRSS